MSCECHEHQRPRWPPPPPYGKNVLNCRLGHGIKKLPEMSVLFFDYVSDFPAIGVENTIYVATKEQKLCYYDDETMSYPAINSAGADEEAIEKALGEMLVVTTNEEVDEFCKLPQEPTAEEENKLMNMEDYYHG